MRVAVVGVDPPCRLVCARRGPDPVPGTASSGVDRPAPDIGVSGPRAASRRPDRPRSSPASPWSRSRRTGRPSRPGARAARCGAPQPAEPRAEPLVQAALLLVRVQLADGRVGGGPDQHGDGQRVEPDEQHDRSGQRAVDRGGPVERRGDRAADDERGHDPQHHRHDRTGGVTQPRRPARCRDVVEAGEATDGQQRDQRPVQHDQPVPAGGHDLAEQARPEQHERDRDDPQGEGQQVQRERQRPGADDAAHAGLAVHDRDGVDEDVQGARPRPQREHEAQREQVEARAGGHVARCVGSRVPSMTSGVRNCEA